MNQVYKLQFFWSLVVLFCLFYLFIFSLGCEFLQRLKLPNHEYSRKGPGLFSVQGEFRRSLLCAKVSLRCVMSSSLSPELYSMFLMLSLEHRTKLLKSCWTSSR